MIKRMRPYLMFDMTIDGDTLTGSDLEHQEISVLVLYLLQSAPVQANLNYSWRPSVVKARACHSRCPG